MELYGNSVQPVAVDMHNLCCPGAQHDFASLSSSGIGPPPFVAGAPFATGCTSYKWGPFAAPCSQPVEISHAEPMPMSLHASPVAQQIECANPRQGFHLPHPVSETTTGGTCGPAVLLDPQPRDPVQPILQQQPFEVHSYFVEQTVATCPPSADEVAASRSTQAVAASRSSQVDATRAFC